MVELLQSIPRQTTNVLQCTDMQDRIRRPGCTPLSTSSAAWVRLARAAGPCVCIRRAVSPTSEVDAYHKEAPAHSMHWHERQCSTSHAAGAAANAPAGRLLAFGTCCRPPLPCSLRHLAKKKSSSHCLPAAILTEEGSFRKQHKQFKIQFHEK